MKITTTEGDYSVATADYTVNWVCGEEVLKTDSRTGDVGATINLVASDTQSFEVNGNRYIYVKDDAEGKTIANDGTTVLTITYREAEKWNYTITSSYTADDVENTLAWKTSGEVWEDLNTITISYPRYQAFETTLVGLAPVNNNLQTSITVSEDGYTRNLAYTSEGIDNLFMLSEAENLESGNSTNATTYTSRVSNGLIIYGSEGSLTTLPAGKYIFTLGAIGGDNTSHQVAYTVSAGNEQIASGNCTGNFLTLIKSREFVLTEETAITFTCSDPASGRGIDLIYVQKTGDILTLTSTAELEGYKTFYNKTKSFEVDENTTIYKAGQVSGGKVVITAVEGKIIPANTPVILKTTAAGYQITLTETTATSTDVFSDNALRAATANGTIDGAYILAYTTADGLGFYNFTGSLDAGDVYVTAAAGAKLRIALAEDDATGIQTVASEVAEGAIYNVAGQRVNAAYKGIIIKNGKKYLNK
ncbi:MAG: hypothetical protein IJV06_06375 [Bacteroidaceae bacterium]|nr:hypothetical protein [Bacteroidaceae bacterium]